MKRRGPLAWSWMAVLVSLAATQPAERVPSIDPNHYLPSMNPCYDESGVSQRCVPDFINVAFTLKVDVSNTCGVREPTKYCVQSGAMGHAGISKNCDICDNRDYRFAHPPEYLTDFNNPDNETWWQSETMNEGVQHPNNVTLTLGFRKAYDITYVRLKFMSPRPESFAIYKKTTVDGEWIPWQFYSGSCRATYHMAERAPILPGNEAVAQCTREFSDISPLTGGNIAFSTLDGRPSAENFEESEVLQEWVTAVAIRVVLSRLNTFGDEVFRDPRVLKSYYYAISDLAVGGRCKCNGHASQCVRSTGGGEDVFVCDCKHHTTGADCQICEPFYHDRPWRAATSEEANECLPCECNGLARRCYFDDRLYAETGHGGHCLDCAGNTHGPHCEHCAANHWRRPGETFCVACGCSEKGSSSLQCDEAGQCPCKPGVTGQRCDQCQAGHFDLGPSGCQDCRCEPAGSRDNAPDCSPLTGECSCKANVEGRRCDKCKPGYFNLSPRNHYGCTPCFCYGHSSVCAASEGFYAVNVSSNFFEGNDKWTAASDRRIEDVQYAQLDKAIAVSQFDNAPVYFLAPEKYLGDQRHAYNQDLIFTLRVQQSAHAAPSKKDIILISASGRELSLPVFAQNNPRPSLNETTYRFRIHADYQLGWQPSLREIDFIGILSNLTAIKIRATYSERDVGYLSSFHLGTASVTAEAASEDFSPVEADWIETCNCTEGYIGQFCESCAPGYRREVKFGGALVKCVLCDCHDHSESCDAESGACICQHNTAGDSCESCSRGYYGNALNGTSDDCKKCDCPEDGPCVELPSGETVCTECPHGYAGTKCKECAEGFFGNPEEGVPCQECQCNGNIDINSINNCNSLTGECLRCIYHTRGFNCDKCEAGFWGDALAEEKNQDNCKACQCYEPGTKRKGIDVDVLECAQEDGQCECQPNVVGQRCDACEEGFFNLTSGSGCQACDCDPLGSLNVSCEVATGRCVCKPGVTGRRCDQCIPMHYGFSADGCRPCDCDRLGSESLACDVANGQCLCRENVEGRRCDQCSENRYNLAAGCLACDDCYTLIQQRKDEINSSVVVLRENLDEIQNSPVEIDDPEFDNKVTEAENLVTDLKETAAEKLDKETGKTLVRHVKELGNDLREAKENLRDVDQRLAGFDRQADAITLELKKIKSEKELVRRELDGVTDYVETDGYTKLREAQEAAERYGDRSAKMSEYAEEARKLGEKHRQQGDEVAELTRQAVNDSQKASKEADDAIYGPEQTSKQIKELKETLEKTLALLNQTQNLAEEEGTSSQGAYDDAARAVSHVQELKLPNVIPEKLKNDSALLKNETDYSREQLNELIANNTEVLANARAAIADARHVMNEAYRVSNETNDEFNRVKAAGDLAKSAVENVTTTWNEAQAAFESLNNFNDNINAKKEEALKALNDFDTIQKDIGAATETSRDAQEALGDAKANSDIALSKANESVSKIDAAETAIEKLEAGIVSLQTDAQNQKGDVSGVKEAVQTLQTTTENFKNQALSDSERANDALKKATRAESQAKALQQKFEDSKKKLVDASRQLNSLDDVSEDDLDKLESVLREAEATYETAESERQLLKERNNKLLAERDVLRRELQHANDELANLNEIYASLPNKCFNQVSLEQEGQK